MAALERVPPSEILARGSTELLPPSHLTKCIIAMEMRKTSQANSLTHSPRVVRKGCYFVLEVWREVIESIKLCDKIWLFYLTYFFNRIPLTADGGQSVGRQEWKQDDHSRVVVKVLERELEGGTGGFGLGRSPGGGHGNPLQHSCLEIPMDRGAWRAIVHSVANSWTWLKRLSMLAHTGGCNK